MPLSALVGAVLGYTAVLSICHHRDPMTKPYPDTRREAIVEQIHGVDVADPYRWLEEVSSAEVKAWMAAQDAYTREQLAVLPGREPLVERLKSLFYFDALGAPVHRGGRTFWTRKHADKEKMVVYWKAGPDGEERVLFDPNTWSVDGSVSLGGWWPTWDGRTVAFNVRPNNADESELHVIDVATGEERGDVIAGTKYADISWTPDGGGFYYTWVPPVAGDVTVPNRPGFAELRFHALGADPAKDEIVYPATGNPETFLGGGVSRAGRWLFAVIQHGWRSSDWYVKDLVKGGDFQPLVVGVDANFSIQEWQDRFYVLTNLDAPRYRILAVDPAHLERSSWVELVPQDRDATIDGMNVVGGRLVVNYLRKAASAMEVRMLDGTLLRTIDLPGAGTTSGMSGEPDEDIAYFSYTSFTEPQIIFETSIARGTVTEWSRVKLPIDTEPYVTEQVIYPSKDGTPISMFLIHRKDVVANGENPTILYGYGGFSVNMTPGFAGSRMVWLEHGGVYAIPNLRGGGEYGEDWHRDGMLDKKQNVFDDFLAAARWLIDNRWTRPGKLAISGGSNGGLLVGAAMTQAPDLFGAVVCAVPLLDMVRYHLFGSGATWVPEYGSAEDEAQFRTLYAYSPYHRVEHGVKYPALLMLSADSDDRVDPMHARKLTAAVQWATSSDAPVLLRIEANAGHGGADLVKQQIQLVADTYVFLWSQLL